mmetsp:Transcript_39782/g.119617  ORF Transcript_39782/g.119617 Transcript_39782/m.119617 type:complete len:182 (-) Transcript_39782:5025-5570(-)
MRRKLNKSLRFLFGSSPSKDTSDGTLGVCPRSPEEAPGGWQQRSLSDRQSQSVDSLISELVPSYSSPSSSERSASKPLSPLSLNRLSPDPALPKRRNNGSPNSLKSVPENDELTQYQPRSFQETRPKPSSRRRRKCAACYLGGSSDPEGLSSALLGRQRAKICPRIRCTACDFIVLRFPGK